MSNTIQVRPTSDLLQNILKNLLEAQTPEQLSKALTDPSIGYIDITDLGPINTDSYTRFELVESESVRIVLIVWQPGAFTPPHDHGGSDCTFVVLQGTATEKRYEYTNNSGRVTLVETDHIRVGQVASCNGQHIHAMGNDSTADQQLITLHLYRPRPDMREHVA